MARRINPNLKDFMYVGALIRIAYDVLIKLEVASQRVYSKADVNKHIGHHSDKLMKAKSDLEELMWAYCAGELSAYEEDYERGSINVNYGTVKDCVKNPYWDGTKMNSDMNNFITDMILNYIGVDNEDLH